MTKWLVWVLATLACGGAPEAKVVASGAAAPQAETIVLGGDSRFATGDVPTPPPPRPQRQIDRGEAGPADLRKAREVDKTLAKDNANQPGTDAPHDTSMLVYTAHVTMAVYQVSPALDAIEAVAREMGGYLALRNDTQIEIRVPRAHFEDALHKIEASGDVIHREVAAQDVTDAYVDMEARLKNARAVRDRLQALLDKAAVKEAIEIQRELERVTGEIESLEGKLKVLRDRVAYSTIDVAFQPRGAAALHDTPIRLPFPWLGVIGLPTLLDMSGVAQ